MPSLKKSNIILGVTGGIAAYKACELVRLFVKAGHEVRVVMSAHAESFVGAITFESLSGNKVLRSLTGGGYDLTATSHIDLAQWGDLFLVAPATANFMAKFAGGIADDALLTEGLAFTGPILLAPAMNTRMWEAVATQENFARLRNRGVYFVGPESGDLACGETGLGKMSEPAAIFERAQKVLGEAPRGPLYGLEILVTSGPTRSYLDPIRYITNRSSGRMGHAIANAAEKMGAHVTLVTGPVESTYATLKRGEVIKVETTAQMAEAVQTHFKKAQMVFATAAVSDYEASQVAKEKLPRSGTLDVKLRATRDVIGEASAQKQSKQVIVGFAAEFGNEEPQWKKAEDKLTRKRLDLLAFNNVARTDIGFDSDENEILLFSASGKEPWPKLPKSELAERLLKKAYELWKIRQ